MKFLRRLIQIDKHQEISNSGYECEQFDLPSKLAEVAKLILYLYAKDLCSYKISSRTVWAQSFSPNTQKHLYAEWKWKICTIKLIGKRNTGRFPHSQVFHLLSQFTHTIPGVLSSPLNFPELYCLRLHLLFASLQLMSVFIVHCKS